MLFGSAPLSSLNWTKCETPGLDESKDPIKTTYFKMFMESYLYRLQANIEALTLGYSIKAEIPKPNVKKPPLAATFLPTLVRY